MRAIYPALLLLAACGYEPPAQTDQSTPTYSADLGACRDSAAQATNAQNAKTGLAWFSSPFRRWGQIGDGVQACMAGKGYGQLRWCSEEELRTGTRASTIVVTASGIRCSEEGAPERRRAG